jgi:polysaccharide deacetylase 2 family uncharacterized protein YibQ
MIKKLFIILFSLSILTGICVAGIKLLEHFRPGTVPPGLTGIVSKKLLIQNQTGIQTYLVDELHILETNDSDIVLNTPHAGSGIEIFARVPNGMPVEWIVMKLTVAADKNGYRVDDCIYDRNRKKCVIDFVSKSTSAEKCRLTISRSDRFFSSTARIALLIDNFDFMADEITTGILSFPEPLTISLDPLSKKSSWTAKAAMQYNKEIIIRMAFESTVKTSIPESLPLIMVHLPEDSLRRIVNESVKNIPDFSGFTNVFGSRALEDTRVMEIVLKEIYRHNGYFVETRTARNSVVSGIASSISLPYAAVSYAVPANVSSEIIKQSFSHFCNIAQKKGTLVISAPASSELILALTEYMDTFERNGVRLVPVSEIARSKVRAAK